MATEKTTPAESPLPGIPLDVWERADLEMMIRNEHKLYADAWAKFEAMKAERDALAAKLEQSERTQRLLSQVALEAIRLVHGSELGDHYSHEPCGECGLGGAGAIRDALRKALGEGYTTLVWGNDMNIDGEAWTKRLEAAGKGGA